MKTKLNPAGKVFLVITSSIAIGGAIKRAGAVIEVSEPDAVRLLERGKARLATEDDVPAPVDTKAAAKAAKAAKEAEEAAAKAAAEEAAKNAA